MLSQAEDPRAEAADFCRFLGGLSPEAWEKPTPSKAGRLTTCSATCTWVIGWPCFP